MVGANCYILMHKKVMTKILESYTVDEVANAIKLHPYTVVAYVGRARFLALSLADSGGLMLWR